MSGANLKANARRLIIQNAPAVFLVCLVYLLFAAVLSQLRYYLPGTVDTQGMYERLYDGEPLSVNLIFADFRPAGVVLAVLLYLFQPVFDAGYMYYCLKITRSENPVLKDIFYGFYLCVKIIALFIVILVFVLLWCLLFIVPGIIASYRYRLSYYILLDDPDKGILQCIDESVSMMNGAKLDLFIIDISFLGWYLTDILISMLIPLPFVPPVVMIWLAPYRGITNAQFYELQRGKLTV